MNFKLYISKPFIKDFIRFKDLNGDNTSRKINCLISDFIKNNLEINIPALRKTCLNNPDNIRKLRELLEEIG